MGEKSTASQEDADTRQGSSDEMSGISPSETNQIAPSEQAKEANNKNQPFTTEQLEALVKVWEKTIDVQQHFNDLELRIRGFWMTVVGGLLGAVAFTLKENLMVKLGPIKVPYFFISLVFLLLFLQGYRLALKNPQENTPAWQKSKRYSARLAWLFGFVSILLGVFGFTLTIPEVFIQPGAFLVLLAMIMTFAIWMTDRHWYHNLLYGAVEHGMKVEKALSLSGVREAGLTKTIGEKSPSTFLGLKIRSPQKISLFYVIALLALSVLLVLVAFSTQPVTTTSKVTPQLKPTTTQSPQKIQPPTPKQTAPQSEPFHRRIVEKTNQ